MSNIEKLTDIIDGSLELLNQYNIKKPISILNESDAPSLLDQCLELCEHHKAFSQEPIRLIYHIGFNEQFFSTFFENIFLNTTITSNLLSSPTEIFDKKIDSLSNALGIKEQINPVEHNELMDATTQFNNQMEKLYKVSNTIGQRLLFIEKIVSEPEHNDYLSLSDFSNVIHTVAVIICRNPLDAYQSYLLNIAEEEKPLSLDLFSKNILAFLDQNPELKILRIEDYLESPHFLVQKVNDLLKLPFNENQTPKLENIPEAFNPPQPSEELNNYFQVCLKLNYKIDLKRITPSFPYKKSAQLKSENNRLKQEINTKNKEIETLLKEKKETEKNIEKISAQLYKNEDELKLLEIQFDELLADHVACDYQRQEFEKIIKQNIEESTKS